MGEAAGQSHTHDAARTAKTSYGPTTVTTITVKDAETLHSTKTTTVYPEETVGNTKPVNAETIYTTKPIYTPEAPLVAPSSSTPQTISNNSPPIGVIVGTTIGGIILLLVGAFLLLWYYQRRRNPRMYPYSGTFPDPLQEMPNHQISGFHSQGDTINDQRHELPAQEMSHAQEPPIGHCNPHEPPVEKKR